MTAARSARKGTLVAVISTLAVATLVAISIGLSPSWPLVQKAFFDGTYFSSSLPDVIGAFAINIQLFVLAEILILPIGLLIALARSITSPALAHIGAVDQHERHERPEERLLRHAREAQRRHAEAEHVDEQDAWHATEEVGVDGGEDA